MFPFQIRMSRKFVKSWSWTSTYPEIEDRFFLLFVLHYLARIPRIRYRQDAASLMLIGRYKSPKLNPKQILVSIPHQRWIHSSCGNFNGMIPTWALPQDPKCLLHYHRVSHEVWTFFGTTSSEANTITHPHALAKYTIKTVLSFLNQHRLAVPLKSPS